MEESTIKKYNASGWVLYYVSGCPIIGAIREKIGWALWMQMNKAPIDVIPGERPANVDVTPIWRNSHTGELWDGRPIYRES